MRFTMQELSLRRLQLSCELYSSSVYGPFLYHQPNSGFPFYIFYSVVNCPLLILKILFVPLVLSVIMFVMFMNILCETS